MDNLTTDTFEDEEPRVRNEDDEDKKKLVVLYHDESIYNTNEGQSWMWGENEHPALLPTCKTKHSGTMVTDFIKEHAGYLAFTLEEHEIAKPNFHPSPSQLECCLSMVQIRRAIGRKKNSCLRLRSLAISLRQRTMHLSTQFVFDQSSCHKNLMRKHSL